MANELAKGAARNRCEKGGRARMSNGTPARPLAAFAVPGDYEITLFSTFTLAAAPGRPYRAYTGCFASGEQPFVRVVGYLIRCRIYPHLVSHFHSRLYKPS